MSHAGYRIRNSSAFFMHILAVASLATFSHSHVFPQRLVDYDYWGHIDVHVKKYDEWGQTEGIIATVPRNGCVPKSG